MDKEYLVVDGYNVINSWPDLSALKEESLEHARDKLVQIMQNYAVFKDVKVIVVFDGQYSLHKTQSLYKEDKVEVLYSKKGETADMVIEKLIDSLPQDSKKVVATSDWVEQRIILGKGALRMSVRELFIRVQEAEMGIKKEMGSRKSKSSSSLEGQLKESIREKFDNWRRKP